MCWTQPYTRHRTTTSKTNNTTLYVGHNHTQDTGRRQTRQITQHYMCWTQPYTRHRRRQTRQITQHYMCWTQPYTRHRTTTKKTNKTTLYLLDTTCRRPVSCVWLCPTNIVLCYLSCLSSSCVLCMVVSNTYSVVLFVMFVVVLCLVYGGVQHI
jgi:hypothetical protein